jgi:hypothetical protein
MLRETDLRAIGLLIATALFGVSFTSEAVTQVSDQTKRALKPYVDCLFAQIDRQSSANADDAALARALHYACQNEYRRSIEIMAHSVPLGERHTVEKEVFELTTRCRNRLVFEMRHPQKQLE